MVRPTKRRSRAAFTLVELMVATGVTVILAVALFAFSAQCSESLRAARSAVDEMQVAQRAFETITHRIGQATLNNYWDSILSKRGARWSYERMSELRFACGPMQCGANPLDSAEAKSERMHPGHGIFFQAATGYTGNTRDPALAGLENLVNTLGYFVEAGPDELKAPNCIPPQLVARRIAPRLMELREPAQRLNIYGLTSGKPDYAGLEWLRKPLEDRTQVRVVVENVVALVILPKLTAQETSRLRPGGTKEECDSLLAPQLFYHSGTNPPANIAPAQNMRHRLPAMVEVTMVALDAASVARLYRPDELDPLKLRDAFCDARELREELFFDPAHPARDSLERRLIDARAKYRLFTATVPIRSAQ